MTMNKMIAPCVGVVCFRHDGVLIIKRDKPPKQGEWSIPGGRIEFGEKAEDAALRELQEETGVNAALIGLVDIVDGIFCSESAATFGHHYLLCDYAAIWLNGEPQAGSDAASAEFVSPERLVELPLWEETRRVISKARELVLIYKN